MRLISISTILVSSLLYLFTLFIIIMGTYINILLFWFYLISITITKKGLISMMFLFHLILLSIRGLTFGYPGYYQYQSTVRSDPHSNFKFYSLIFPFSFNFSRTFLDFSLTNRISNIPDFNQSHFVIAEIM